MKVKHTRKIISPRVFTREPHFNIVAPNATVIELQQMYADAWNAFVKRMDEDES
jgi:hypothetical protein